MSLLSNDKKAFHCIALSKKLKESIPSKKTVSKTDLENGYSAVDALSNYSENTEG